MVGMVYCNAQSGKRVYCVRQKVQCVMASPGWEGVSSLLDGNGIEFHLPDVAQLGRHPSREK